MLIRTSAVDITPPELLPLGGYTERKGVKMLPGGDPLYARTLILEDGKTRVAIVSLEMLTVPESLYREVKKRLPDDLSLFMAAVHTHCAPDSQMLNERMTFPVPGIAKFDKKWLDWYSEKIAGGVQSALSAAPISSISLGLRQGKVSLNRPRRKNGTPDPTSNELDAGSRKLITEYEAHATIFGPEENHTRGDWPGAVAAETGGLVLVGAIGDVSPAVDGKNRSALVTQFRDKLERSLKVHARAVWHSGQALTYLQQPIALDPPVPHPTFATTYHAPEALAQLLVKQFAEPQAWITGLRIGDLALIGVPGEPTGALGLRIAAAGRKMGFRSVIVCSHVNGWIGYILAPGDYDRGGYEATLSLNGRMTGERVVDAAIETLRKLR